MNPTIDCQTSVIRITRVVLGVMVFFVLSISSITAYAAPVFTWEFNPAQQIATIPTGPLLFDAVVRNTGTTTINSLTGYTGDAIGNIGYQGTFGIANGLSLEQQFSGINLLPSQEFNFTFFTLTPDMPMTGFATVNGTLSLGDAMGGSAFIPSTNSAQVTVIPEPSTISLLGIGSLSMILGRRRK